MNSNDYYKSFFLGALTASVTYWALQSWWYENSARSGNAGIEAQVGNNQNKEDETRQELSYSVWRSMISSMLSDPKNDIFKRRWRWESIRRQIRRRTCSSQKLWDDMIRFIRIHGFTPFPRHESENGDMIDDNDNSNEEDYDRTLNRVYSSDDVQNAEKSGLCIGSIFGLDVGGTLAKLVYFEKHDFSTNIHSKVNAQDSHSNEDLTKLLRARQASLPDALLTFRTNYENHHPHHHDHDDDDDAVERDDLHIDTERIRKSQSMFNLTHGDERAMALSKFYIFARNLDSYASGVKENDLSFYSRALGGDFHFIQFETRRMPAALELIRISSFHRNILHIGATGGGAHRFSHEFQQILGIQMVKQDELESMVAGLQFALRDCPNECYTFVPNEDAMKKSDSSLDDSSRIDEMEISAVMDEVDEASATSHRQQQQQPRRRWRDSDQYWWSKKELRESSSTAKQYPYLLVMIGTGVSILRVDGPRKHERISGSTIGGGTYWGLCRLLTDAEDFQSALELAKRGDATKVDMLVGDIYGPNSGALEKLGLSANIVASSFGKLVSKQSPAEGLNQMDLARALLLMVTNNIGQVALLNARLHNTKRIFFIGNFLRHNIISQQRLAFSLAYWSQGKMEALFLEHEGYFGSLGAFLLSQGINSNIKQATSTSELPQSTRSSKRYRARSI